MKELQPPPPPPLVSDPPHALSAVRKLALDVISRVPPTHTVNALTHGYSVTAPLSPAENNSGTEEAEKTDSSIVSPEDSSEPQLLVTTLACLYAYSSAA